MEIKTSLRFLRVAPRKARLVADLIRGKDVNTALGLLKFINKSASVHISKLIRSAVANAEAKGTVDVDNLYIKFIGVYNGPSMKRLRPAPMGRGLMIRKRFCHIDLILDEK